LKVAKRWSDIDSWSHRSILSSWRLFQRFRPFGDVTLLV